MLDAPTSAMRSPQRVVAWLLVFMVITLAGWLLTRFMRIWRQRTLRHFNVTASPASQASIQSGDLYMSRYEGTCEVSDRVLRTLTGPGWTHVGVFHRDRQTGELFVLDFGDKGVEHVRLVDRMYYYAGHIGVRRLKQPLDVATSQHFQELVKKVTRGHNQLGKSISVGTHEAAAEFRVVRLDPNPTLDAGLLVNLRKPGNGTGLFWEACVAGPSSSEAAESAICTDFVRVILQRLGILPREPFSSCTHPSFYMSAKEVNRAYHPVERLKYFDTDHDLDLDYCSHKAVTHMLSSF